MKTATLLACLLTFTAFAAKKDRPWKTGKVTSSRVGSQSYESGAFTSAQVNGNSGTATTSVQHVTEDYNLLIIEGQDYFYLIEDGHRSGGGILTSALANRKRGCRFVIDEDIRYFQEKDRLWVLDADGKECKLPILKQAVSPYSKLKKATDAKQ